MRTSRFVRALVVTALVAVAAVTGNSFVHTTRAEAVTLVADPERNSITPILWQWANNYTPSQVTSKIGSSYRLTDLEVTSVDDAGVPRLSMVSVQNVGSYLRSGWSWKTNLTAAGIASTLGSTYRLIDLERYTTSAGTRYAIVYVPNSGAQQKAGGYLLGRTSTYVASFLSSNGGRLIDIETYLSGTSRLVNAIWIKNTGVDARTSHVHYGKSISDITAGGERILTMERRSTGTYDAITVAHNTSWFHLYGLNSTVMNNAAIQLGARISRIEPRGDGTYDAVLLDNVNTETRRVRELARTKMGPYSWGFYVKRMGASEVVGLQRDTIFEPASAIKVVHHLAELRYIAADTDNRSLGDRMIWYSNPDKSLENAGDGPNTCPDYTEGSTNAVRTSVRQALYGMMWDSDNRLTRAMTLRRTLPALNELTDTLGMTRTQINQDRIGCGWLNGNKNSTTLADLGRLYEKAGNGTGLASSQKPNFIDLMINVTNPGYLRAIIDDEGAKLGKSAEIIAAFKARVLYYAKGGSYGFCTTESNPCNSSMTIYTEAGVVSLPTRIGGSVDFAFGRFMQGTVDCTSACSAVTTTATEGYNATRAEMMRSSIRLMLSGW